MGASRCSWACFCWSTLPPTPPGIPIDLRPIAEIFIAIGALLLAAGTFARWYFLRSDSGRHFALSSVESGKPNGKALAEWLRHALAGYNGSTRQNRANTDFFFESGAGARDTYVQPRIYGSNGLLRWVSRSRSPGWQLPPRYATTHANLAPYRYPRRERADASHAVSGGYRRGWPTGSGIDRDTGSGKPLAGVVLDAAGRATATIDLAGGDHGLFRRLHRRLGHLGSSSEVTPVHAVSGSTPDFSVSIAPATLSLKQGQSGSATVSITPVNAASLTAPMFVTISCAGLPDQSACTFTPENIEIPVGATAAIDGSLVLSTQATSLARAEPNAKRGAQPIALAVLLPGAFVLGGIAFGARRRRFLSRLVLLSLVAFVSVLGTVACAPLYNYHNHGPPYNLPTPAGSYSVTIAAQSSNGVTATTHTTTIALTVTK